MRNAENSPQKQKPGFMKAYWVKNWLLAGSLIFGIVLAIVHDQIYAHFDGKPVSSPVQQEWLGRAGTGLAFLIKKLFSTAVGTACVQMLWWSISHKPVTVKTIDASFHIVQNPFVLQNGRLFTEAPVIVLLAVIAWFMPIAALIGPPTLTVVPNAFQSTSVKQIHVPTINWTSPLGGYINVQGGEYAGVQPGLQRVAMQVALSNQPLALEPPKSLPNVSYSLKFNGPAIQCENANDSWYNWAEIAANYGGENVVWYMGWTPYNICDHNFASNSYELKNLTTYLHISPSYDCNNPSDPIFETVDAESIDSAQIFVATWANGLGQPSAIYQCELYNASYEAEFNFTNGVSSFEVQNRSILNPISMADADNPTVDVEYQPTEARAYISMMDALGHVLIGYVTGNAFSAIISETGSMVTKTPLIETKDFSTALSKLGLGPENPGSSDKALGTAVEEMMTNMTMSLFSQSAFQVATSDYPSVDASVIRLENVYHYSRWQLLAAYGIGAFFTLLSVLIGFWCLHANEAAYSNSFSTMMRVMRDADFRTLVNEDDTSGVDPIPKYMTDVKVKLERLDGMNNENDLYAIKQVPDSNLIRSLEDGNKRVGSTEIESEESLLGMRQRRL